MTSLSEALYGRTDEYCTCNVKAKLAGVLSGAAPSEPCPTHEREEHAEFERQRIRRLTDEFFGEYDTRTVETKRVEGDPFRRDLAAAVSRNYGTGLGITASASEISSALGLAAEPTSNFD